jgi:hypothetical protein
VKKKNCGRTRGLKTFGFVGFTDANNAKKALENFNGYELEGRRIRVEFARPHPATLRFNLQKQACHDSPAPSSTGVDGVDSDGDDGSDDSDSNDDNGDDDDDDDSGDDSQHINSSISQPSVCDHRGYCAHFRGVRTARFLVDLYLLADKLKDPVSANMATDEIINLNEFDLALSELLVDFIYDSTPRHSPLRKFARDWYIYEADYDWINIFDTEKWHEEFIHDVVHEIWTLRKNNPNKSVSELYNINYMVGVADRYHQPVERDV